MSLPIPALSVLIDLANQVANGQTFEDLSAGIQSSVADLTEAHNRVKSRLEAISSVAGTIVGLTNAQSMALAGAHRATTQTTVNIDTTIPYDATFTVNSVVVAKNGLTLDTTAYSLANNAGTLRVVLVVAAITSDVFVIRAFSIGAGVLASLISTANGQGASLVGIEDAALNTAATTVEGALVDLFSKTVGAAGLSYLSGLLTLANYVKKDGSVAMTGPLAMGAQKITGLADGTQATDAATFGQLTSYLSTISGFFSLAILSDGLVTFAANQSMGSHRLTDLAAPVAGTDASTKQYVDDTSATGDTALQVQVTALQAAGAGSRVAGYATPGTQSFVVPAGVTNIRFEVWGGGAGGGVNDNPYSGFGLPNGYGGGGGGHAFGTIDTTPGETLTINVGAGGAANGNGALSDIKRGAATLAIGYGGTSNVGGSAAVNSPATGVAMTAPTAAPAGTQGGAAPKIGFAANGTGSPRGGAGGQGGQRSDNTPEQAAVAGTAPGGGGGGGRTAGLTGVGGAGLVILTY